MKKIFVSGAAGFIGSHLTETLVHKGYQLKAFVRYNSSNNWGWLDMIPKEIKNEIEVCSGDIRDPYGMKNALRGCDAVLHLAALIAIPYSYHSPETYIDTNIKGTLNLLQACRELDIQRFIHTSTSEVYGTALKVPITEDHPLQPQSPYSASKIGADQLAMSFYYSFNLPVAVIRPFNTYGPRQSARAVIPTIISQLVHNQKQIKIGALHPTRDFNYINDTVNGFIHLLEATHITGEIINIGSNYEISIGELANLIAEIMGKEVEWIVEEQRIRPASSEVERLYASNQKAKELMGWSPAFAGIEGLKKGLQQTIQWFENPSNRSLYKHDIYNL